MDLVGEMLHRQLSAEHAPSLGAQLIRPRMRYRFSSEDASRGTLFNLDRLLNRFWYYPRHLDQVKNQFDVFHVVDHSYGQLVHSLPAERTVVTCHDLDAFRCLLSPETESRSYLFRVMINRVLEGFLKAARITCDSMATRNELLSYSLVQPERVVVVHNGVSPLYTPIPVFEADAEAARLLGPPSGKTVDILHVGSTVGRKRVDVLLRVFAEVRREFPHARLIRVGGAFTGDQLRLVEALEISDAVVVLPFLEERVLPAIYRRAALVLQPSEREGFGLPVVEALACGTHVVASDLPVLREVGGEAVSYVAVGDVFAWKEAVNNLLRERQDDAAGWAARREAGLEQASKFGWSEYARKMAALYQELV